MIRSLIASVALLTVSHSALAQTCTETQFTSANGQLYLDAENALLQEKNPTKARGIIQQLMAQELNCYERASAMRIQAAAALELKDYNGAARIFEQILANNPPADERTKMLNTLAQIYLQAQNKPQALNYFKQWANSGGRPERDDFWTMAVLSQQTGDERGAIQYAERVFQIDGPNAERQVYDFLIYLYDKTGRRADKARLLESLLARNPSDKKIWEAIAGDYYKAGEERRAFEVQKAMFHGGLLSGEEELMRIVNFYNRFDVPYHSARFLEQQINAGNIQATYERLELLANLYQVSREYERAVPVIERAAQQAPNGEMYERLARSYAELQEWAKVEEAARSAIDRGGIRDKGLMWVLIGQSRYERDNIEGAREAFRNAGNRGGSSWLQFLNAEARTSKALACFDINNAVLERVNEQRACVKLRVLGDEPESCTTVDQRLEEARARVQAENCDSV